jgi:hypothetical protein
MKLQSYARELMGMSPMSPVRERVREGVRERFRERVGEGALGARALGWASIGIGVTEIAAPGWIEQTMGIGDGENTGILRTLGAREILHGVDILSHRDPTPGVKARVAGDVLDGVLLGMAAKRTRRPDGFATIAAMVTVIAMLDLYYAWRLERMRR